MVVIKPRNERPSSRLTANNQFSALTDTLVAAHIGSFSNSILAPVGRSLCQSGGMVGFGMAQWMEGVIGHICGVHIVLEPVRPDRKDIGGISGALETIHLPETFGLKLGGSFG